MEHPSLKAEKAALSLYLRFPIPVLTETSTESERIWRAFLLEKHMAYNALCAS